MPFAPRELADFLPRSQRQRLLLRALRQQSSRQIRRLLLKVHPADIAELFALLPPGEQQRLLEILFDLRLAARTLRELDPGLQKQIMADLPDDRLAVMLARLSADDSVELLRLLDEERRDQILGHVEHGAAIRLRNLMQFGEETAGGIMNPDVVFFRAEESVSDTLARLRELAQRRRIFYLYVTDERGHLAGIVNLWQLVTADADRTLAEIMGTDVVTVQVGTPQEEVARVFARYDLLMVPVLDEDGRLVGAITVDDVIDVIEEEATEDFYRLANLDTDESVSTPIWRSVRLRHLWLQINLLTAFLAAAVVWRFEPSIAKFAVLAVFMPIVPGMGGNAGTQSLTVVVRGLALGELDLRRSAAVILKEAAVGLLNGLGTGLVLALVAYFWERNLILALILLIAETVNLVVAGLAGASIPLLLRRLNLDPALGSSIFVTTATDVSGFLSFLGIATLLLHYLM